jgi:hypothetical protein
MSKTLDELLARKLPEIADDGFSGRVMAELSEAILRRSRIETRILAALIIAATAILPLTNAGRQLAVALLSLDMTPMIAIAAVATLSYWYLERATD